MKRILSLVVLLSSLSVLAQSPQKFNYQAVVRNADGTLITNQSVNFRMSIYIGSSAGTIKYQETQVATTNKYGLVALSIGSGIIVSGSMSSINWGNDAHVLRVEIDPTGGNSFNILSTSELNSVPYALYALSSGNGSGGGSDNDADSTNEIQTISVSNDTVFLSKGGFAVIPPSSAVTNDNDSTNELQTITISTDTLFLSDGGFAVLPSVGGTNNDNDSTNELNTAVALVGTDLNVTDADGTLTADLSSLEESQAIIDTAAAIRADFPAGLINNDNDSTNELNTAVALVGTDLNVTDADGTLTANLSSLEESQAIIDSAAAIRADFPTVPANNDNDATNELNTTVALIGTDLNVTDPGATLTADLSSLEESQAIIDSAAAIRADFPSVAPNNDNDATNELNTTVALIGTDLNVTDPGATLTADLSSLEESQAIIDSAAAIRADFPTVPANNDNDATNELNTTVALVGTDLNVTDPGATLTADLSSLEESQAIIDSAAAIRADFPTVAPNNDNDATNELNTTVALVGTDLNVTDPGATLTADLSSLEESQAIIDSAAAIRADFPTVPANNDNDSTNELNTAVALVGTDLNVTDADGTLTADLSSLEESQAIIDSAAAIRSDIFWKENGSDINYSGTGRVSIGTSTPVAKLDITSGAFNTGISSVANSTGENIGVTAFTEAPATNNNTQYGIRARAGIEIGATGTGRHYGILAEAYGSGVGLAESVGVRGFSANKSTGASRGVSGTSNSSTASNNQGVYAQARGAISGGGHNAGLVTDSRDHSVTNYGVLNLTEARGTNNYGTANFAYWFSGGAGGTKNYGSYNWVASADTNIGVFVDASISASSQNYGVWSKASGTNSLAGFFEGDVTISGNLNITGSISKGSGTFKIDHPLDPENKYLVHSFVESPDMMNVYNGNATTDANGLAIIELPEYVEVSNKDFRYQLTPIGQFAQCIVKEEVNGDKFVIQTDKPNVKVSWQVTGIRNDPYAKENRVIVEEEKSTNEKGHYLHPEVYGKDKSKSVHPTMNSKTKEEVLEMTKSAKAGSQERIEE